VVTALAVVPIVAASVGSSPAQASSGASGSTRQIARAGTAGFQSAPSGTTASGGSTQEIGGVSGDGSVTANRTHSTPGSSTPAGAVSQPKSVTNTNPGLVTSFDGLNHFQNRFGSTSGVNQFSLEPPDQGLCVGPDGNGNTRILEVLNDVLRVYDTSGGAVTSPQALNNFFGYTPAINRSTGALGPFVTDPSCIYDAATGHWFLDVLTLDSFPQRDAQGFQHYTGTNHLDLAVSNTSDPTGDWTVYRIPVQDDGTAGTPDHHCSPSTTTQTAPLPTNPNACFGDYPHIGTDANGVYLTTNEYSFFGPEFHGAQVYALSKAQLAALAPTVTVTQFDTHGLDTFGFALNGFTLWPSQTPGGAGDATAGGSEYFLSTNAGAEAHDTGDGRSTFHPSTQLLVWALTNTSSLSGTPALTLSSTKLDVGQYTLPPSAAQKSGPQPLRDCLNQNKCNNILNGGKDPFAETSANLDSNDTRMQQVTYADGKLYGALDTAVSVGGATKAGIGWYIVRPEARSNSVWANLVAQGQLGLAGNNLTYPAIGVNAAGKGVMAFTLVGDGYYPSSAYSAFDGRTGAGSIFLAKAGVGPQDGFSGYKVFGNPPRPRWGDYGATAVDGSTIWIASEYIGQTCTLAQYEATPFGSCGGTRTALANWATRISQIKP
jgi:hypothetical protein